MGLPTSFSFQTVQRELQISLEIRFSFLILVGIPVLMGAQTMNQLEIKFVNLVTPLARLAQEVLRLNVSLVIQPKFSFLILVGIPVLMGAQTMNQLETKFVNLVTPLARPVQEVL
jgi:hypothetical protein